MATLTFDVTTATEDTLRQLVSIPMFVDSVTAELSRRELATTFVTDGATAPSGVHYTALQCVTLVQSTLHIKGEAVPAVLMADIEFLRSAVLAFLGLDKFPKHKWVFFRDEVMPKIATQDN